MVKNEYYFYAGIAIAIVPNRDLFVIKGVPQDKNKTSHYIPLVYGSLWSDHGELNVLLVVKLCRPIDGHSWAIIVSTIILVVSLDVEIDLQKSSTNTKKYGAIFRFITTATATLVALLQSPIPTNIHHPPLVLYMIVARRMGWTLHLTSNANYLPK